MSRTVSLLNRFEDPETSNDPRIRALVQKLSDVDYAPAPRPEFRSELRAQLVAIAGRVISEEQDTAAAGSSGPATLDPVKAAQAARSATVTKLEPATVRPRRSVGRTVGRPLGLAAACCAVLALGLGGAVWKSRSALPGDALYGLKRTSENVQLSLARGDTAKGHEYLKLASTRVQEAQDLLGDTSAMASGSGIQAGGLSPSTVSLIRSTLSSANGDVQSGATLLGTEAVKSHSTSPLSVMTTWAPTQLKQLQQLATSLGNGAAKTSTVRSWTVVDSALTRARTLKPQVTSPHCVALHPDKFGPTACSSAPQRRSTVVAPSSGTAHPSRHASHPGSGAKSGTHSSTGGTKSHGGSGTTHHAKHPTKSGTSNGSAGPTSGPTSIPTTLPTKLPTTLPTLLPTKLVPTLPVSVGSCGIGVNLGPVGLSLGACPSGH